MIMLAGLDGRVQGALLQPASSPPEQRLWGRGGPAAAQSKARLQELRVVPEECVQGALRAEHVRPAEVFSCCEFSVLFIRSEYMESAVPVMIYKASLQTWQRF